MARPTRAFRLLLKGLPEGVFRRVLAGRSDAFLAAAAIQVLAHPPAAAAQNAFAAWAGARDNPGRAEQAGRVAERQTLGT
jgi:hypothetical protein